MFLPVKLNGQHRVWWPWIAVPDGAISTVDSERTCFVSIAAVSTRADSRLVAAPATPRKRAHRQQTPSLRAFGIPSLDAPCLSSRCPMWLSPACPRPGSLLLIKCLGNTKQQNHINKTAGVSMGSSSNDGGDEWLITLFWRLIPEGGWALSCHLGFLLAGDSWQR